MFIFRRFDTMKQKDKRGITMRIYFDLFENDQPAVRF